MAERKELPGLLTPQQIVGLLNENLLPSSEPDPWQMEVAKPWSVGSPGRASPIDFAMAFMPGPKLGRSYQAAPDSLMGFRRNGPQIGFEESNYPHIQYVEVTLSNGDKFVDAMRGLNQPHAIERAYRNWDATNVSPLSKAEALKKEPSLK